MDNEISELKKLIKTLRKENRQLLKENKQLTKERDFFKRRYDDIGLASRKLMRALAKMRKCLEKGKYDILHLEALSDLFPLKK